MELTIGTKTTMVAFFVVETSAAYNALLGQDWIHPNYFIPSALHQFLILWNGNNVKIVEADNKPFQAKIQTADPLPYEEHIGPVRLLGLDKWWRPSSAICIKESIESLIAYQKGSVRTDKKGRQRALNRKWSMNPQLHELWNKLA